MSLISEDWLRKHAGQYADWHPTISISRPGSKQTITIKSREAEKKVVKIMREQKRGKK